ncbi:DUF1285 domain-containing protein [Flocculibacter collagenilyticus]|uniref:DUF1285 domain-containing protein n=1 Tax=Flocculibacter collagenilyticus TaxID=2744479 RepID=UPI0018F66BC6|nr:DUF1285 domain-containing protein [Flocculibacter collagenilyticus]
MNINQLYQQLTPNSSHPPVEQWNPSFCGDIDMQIKHDGTWYYMGTPITRLNMVSLFASVLICDETHTPEKYYLITPVEKVGIQVEDVPFVVTDWQLLSTKNGQVIEYTTNLGDKGIINKDNPLTTAFSSYFNESKSYVTVRRNLRAVLHRNVFYQMIEQGHEKQINGQKHWVITSDDEDFSLGLMD